MFSLLKYIYIDTTYYIINYIVLNFTTTLSKPYKLETNIITSYVYNNKVKVLFIIITIMTIIKVFSIIFF